ncbi:zinc ribbon domain-containing protein [Desulfitibacter alkalitolerans]|uniref:zinc ribbon domain-containing protein n=1 Tax=Desulfitibacter alkalitolerans TaxID=264641 RepID=UPI000688971C|nr:zinc ribbon domain-containing protein [Desulfitibacter alkalitolerans]
MSSFFKKLTETAKTTATTLGAKSAELVTTGKLKMEKMQLEGKVKDKKLEIGNLIYAAYLADEEPIHEAVGLLCVEIKDLENQIAALDTQMKAEESQAAATGAAPLVSCPNCGNQEKEGTAFCSSCGQKLGSKACENCGQNLAPGAKFCAGCGTPVK